MGRFVTAGVRGAFGDGRHGTLSVVEVAPRPADYWDNAGGGHTVDGGCGDLDAGGLARHDAFDGWQVAGLPCVHTADYVHHLREACAAEETGADGAAIAGFAVHRDGACAVQVIEKCSELGQRLEAGFGDVRLLVFTGHADVDEL